MALIKLKICKKKDTISKILLSFSKESISLKKIHIDGADFYTNYEGWEKFQMKEHWRNCLVRLNIEQISLLKWWRMNTLCRDVQHGSVLQYNPVWLYVHTCHGWLPLQLVSWGKAQLLLFYTLYCFKYILNMF